MARMNIDERSLSYIGNFRYCSGPLWNRNTPSVILGGGERKGARKRQLVYQSKWTLEQKIQVVMESLNTSITTAELCRKHNVTPNAFYDWKEKFVQGGKAALAGALKTNPNKELEEEVDRLKRMNNRRAHDCK